MCSTSTSRRAASLLFVWTVVTGPNLRRGAQAFAPSASPTVRRCRRGSSCPIVDAERARPTFARVADDDDVEEEDASPTDGTSRRGFLTSSLATAAALTTTVGSTSASVSDGVASTVAVAAASADSSSTFREAVSGFVAGASVSATKTLVKYPLDTATVRLQRPDTPFSLSDPSALFRGSLRGVAAPLASNLPAGAVFFAVKDAVKTVLRDDDGRPLPRWLVTTLAVAAATPPYWALRNPSEVLKTRQQAGTEGYDETVGAREALGRVWEERALYAGYVENMLYALPADVIKFVVYDAVAGVGDRRRSLSPAEGALAGAGATAVAQLLTTPLDVVRNRVMMSTQNNNINNNNEEEESPSYLESLRTLAAEEGWSGLFAGAAPRVGKAVLSGAIQFATYEETKARMAEVFRGRR